LSLTATSHWRLGLAASTLGRLYFAATFGRFGLAAALAWSGLAPALVGLGLAAALLASTLVAAAFPKLGVGVNREQHGHRSDSQSRNEPLS
jgi:hypothetical protein